MQFMCSLFFSQPSGTILIVKPQDSDIKEVHVKMNEETPLSRMIIL